jgi:uncharacterized protein YndB with AHSA1/START domain
MNVMYILIAVLAIIAVLIGVIATRPAEYRVVRSATLGAPPQDVFTQVNNLRLWEAWSPWAKLDPAMTKSYEGPAEGRGATHKWSGNKHVGEGKVTITESQPPERIRMKLEFIKPFKCQNDVEFTFTPVNDQTLVTWSMMGHNNFMAKAMGLIMNMDKMVGGDFEKGLAAMKSVVEGAVERSRAGQPTS